MKPRIVGSILHGAYGDYYEQAICLKHFRLTHPDTRLKLFAASPHRLNELSVLDWSFAECFEHWAAIPDERIDEFFQFQAHGSELREVLAALPAAVRRKVDERTNRLPWRYLRSLLPLPPELKLGLSEAGRDRLPEIMRANSLSDAMLEGPTVSFLWRHRTASSFIRPFLQQSAEALVQKYSRVLRRAIETLGCRVLICGMKVKTTETNRYRVDAKFPEFGLDLPAETAFHLKGLSWAIEMEIASRATVCMGHPSGFTEALYLRRGGNVMLVDPPPHYLLKLLRHRMPFFDHLTPAGFLHLWTQPHSERRIFAMLRRRLEHGSVVS